MKYKEWIKIWLEYKIRPTTKQWTYNRYEIIVRCHILPELGEKDLDDLTPFALQVFTVKLSGKGLSASTVNVIISALKNSINSAVDFGVTETKCADKLIRPRLVEKHVTCFSKEEQRKIEDYIFSKKTPKLYGILLCLYSGIRLGELLALTWDDVNLPEGLLTISKSCHDNWNDGVYTKIIDTPKTPSSIRVIPLPSKLLTHLADARDKSRGLYVVDNNDQYGEKVRTYQKMFETMLSRMKIAHKGFHSLRHTFATRALECGMDVKSLSEILGHKNPTITLNRYVHSLWEHKQHMMNKLGEMLLQQ